MDDQIEVYPALEFSIENRKRTSKFTKKFVNKLKKSKNPRIYVNSGNTRGGKSLLLNHLLMDKSSNIPRNLRLKSPFPSRGGELAVTIEFLFYGPIKASELCRRNNIKFKGEDSIVSL